MLLYSSFVGEVQRSFFTTNHSSCCYILAFVREVQLSEIVRILETAVISLVL